MDDRNECGVTLDMEILDLELVCVSPVGHGGHHMSAHGIGWSKYYYRSSDYVGEPDLTFLDG